MSELDYTYAVARVRALEISLLTDSDIDGLISARDEEAVLQTLYEKGWGGGETSYTAAELLDAERLKTMKTVKELDIDPSIYRILSYEHLFHNLKAAVKESCTSDDHKGIFYSDTEIPGEEMLKILESKEYSRLPYGMENAAREACETLLHTRNGQLCDIIIDKAALQTIYNEGSGSEEEIIQRYVEDLVAVADIRIAVHGEKTGKTVEFIKDAMVPCKSISIDLLSAASGKGLDSICEYLKGTDYAGGAEALAESMTAFEKWCDNRIIETIQPEKYKAFTAGPVIAYILARESEIKMVRMILLGKANDLPEEFIRERARKMYV